MYRGQLWWITFRNQRFPKTMGFSLRRRRWKGRRASAVGIWPSGRALRGTNSRAGQSGPCGPRPPRRWRRSTGVGTTGFPDRWGGGLIRGCGTGLSNQDSLLGILLSSPFGFDPLVNLGGQELSKATELVDGHFLAGDPLVNRIRVNAQMGRNFRHR